MAIFTPRTFPEILGTMTARLVATTPVTDLNLGSVFTTMLEAAAQEDDEQYFQMLEIIRAFSLDTTTGADLDNRAFEYGLTRNQATTASTFVSINDTAITKIATTVYSGLPGSAAGSMTINGSSATSFPTSGKIIVGRGTPRAESINYTSITNNTSYVTFNLSAGFAFDHGTDETIILSQGGNRSISSGVVVSVPASDISAKIDFTLDASAIILDGEHQVDNVPVTANLPGSSGNVPLGSITIFDSPPFSTATVNNPSRVTNGQDIESDQGLRDRIKSTIQSLSRGTPTSIITGVIGIISTAENKRVVSAALIEPTIPADVVKLYIDDGTGFIPSFADVGFETVVSSATGGEQYLQVANIPVMKAFVIAQNTQPYNLVGGETLFVNVGGVVETVTFASTDFAAPGAALAQEVLIKINNTAQLFEARVTLGGTQIRLFSRSNFGEEIQVAGGTANTALAFPTDIRFTSNLYLTRNGQTKLLTKDGLTAAIECGITESYDFSTEKDLCVVVDGKGRNPQTIFLSPADFATPITGTANEVSASVNNQISGVTAEPSSGSTKVTLTSNLPRSTGSKVRVVETFTQVWNTESSVLVDRTTEFKTAGSDITAFGAVGDVVYLGMTDVKFQSVYVRLDVAASSTVQPLFEYWNGAWTTFTPIDLTSGFTASGHIWFRLPNDWSKTVVNSSVSSYFIRITRQNAGVITSPIPDVVKICSANEVLGFMETEVVGSVKDYTLNRFIGQIQMANPLQPGDNITLGSFNTRAAVSSLTGPYALSGGEVLNVSVDGVPQTVTFVSGDFAIPGTATPVEVVNKLAASLSGVTARTINLGTNVQITTNTNQGGSLQITGGSANVALGFPTALVSNLTPHTPSVVSGSSSPFHFSPADKVVVVMDLNSANNFTVPCTRPGGLTAVADASHVTDSSLNPIFSLASMLTGFDFIYTQVYYNAIQDITYSSFNTNKKLLTVQYIGGGTAGAELVTVVGNAITIKIQSGVSTANQILTAFSASGAATALAGASITGTGTNTQVIAGPQNFTPVRKAVTVYDPTTGNLTLASALPIVPSSGDTYEIAPSTPAQIVGFWTNKKITLLSNNASIQPAVGGTKLQLTSFNPGRNAAVQVSGGTGNATLNFPTTVVLGVDAYRYFTGLAQLTQWTVDGLANDQADYPGIRAAGIQVEVVEPVSVPINIAMTVTPTEGVSLSSIQNDIKSAVSSYINQLPVGGDVIISSIVVAVKGVAGVADVKITVPLTNIAIADNELARVNEANILVG